MRKIKIEIKVKDHWLDITNFEYTIKEKSHNNYKKYTLEIKYEILKKIPKFEPKIIKTQMRIIKEKEIIFLGHCISFEMNLKIAKIDFQDYSYWLEVFARSKVYKFEKMELTKVIEKILIDNGKNEIDIEVDKEEKEITKELKVANETILEVLEILAEESNCNLYFVISEKTQKPVLKISCL